jgi:hypothetical protein
MYKSELENEYFFKASTFYTIKRCCTFCACADGFIIFLLHLLLKKITYKFVLHHYCFGHSSEAFLPLKNLLKTAQNPKKRI